MASRHDAIETGARARAPVNTTICGSPRSGIATPSSNGTLVRQAVETLAHPIDVPVQERAGFVEIALEGKRHDNGAAACGSREA